MSNPTYCVLCKKKHEAIDWRHQKWGSLEGWACGKWFNSAARSHECVPESIKEGRQKYRKELLQPYRSGELSKEYVEAYPNQVAGMVKEGVVSEYQVRNAKNVWYDDNIR